MGKYKKSTPRLNVQIVNSDTDEILFEVPNRNWMNVGELLSDYYADDIVTNSCKRKKINEPEKFLIIISAEFAKI